MDISSITIIASVLAGVVIGIIINRLYSKWKLHNLIKPAKGAYLDSMGELLGITRNQGERDKAYRERLRNIMLMKDKKGVWK